MFGSPYDPCNYLLAWTLLVIPLDLERDLEPTYYPVHALLAIGLEEELIDPREVRWFFQGANQNRWHLRDLRRRYHDLYNAPRLWESKRFPCAEIIKAGLEQNLEHTVWLEGQNHLANEEDKALLYEWKIENDRLERIYRTAADMRSEYYYLNYQRSSLKELRELLGASAFAKGLLPPPVPLHRFREITK